MNRQVGALVSTLGLPKVEALAAQVRDIHPEADLVTFPKGVTPDSIDAFLDGVDLFVDGLDFFAFDIREAVFEACRQRGIPAITVAPLGMGAALLNFLPERMSFRSYFRWQGCDDTEKAIRFLVGLAPALMQRGYLVHASAVDLSRQRGPSTAMACKLCAGVAGTEALKILLGRPGVLAAPWGMQFDAYRYRAKRTWRPGGNANPLQRLAIAIARKSLRAGEGPRRGAGARID